MFINKNSKDKKLKNNILALASDAANAKKLDNSIINATSGILKNEAGVLYEFDCVAKAIKDLNVSEKFAYSNSEGTPAFTKAVLYSIFGKYLENVLKNCFAEVVPSPGGTGALNLAFANYVNPGETVLLPNHMWENYLNMGKDTLAKSSIFEPNKRVRNWRASPAFTAKLPLHSTGMGTRKLWSSMLKDGMEKSISIATDLLI